MQSFTAALQNLTPIQSQVAALLAAGASHTDTAAECGISRQTIYDWQQSIPAFATALTLGRQEYEAAFHDQLTRLTQLAIDTLEQILNNDKASPSVKLRAALAILKRPSQNKPNAWQLPAPVEPLHLTKSDTISTSPGFANTPRNAPCPCGSQLKFKRCCGRNAPPVISRVA